MNLEEHPQEERLRALLAGALAGAELEETVLHLVVCGACRKRLSHLDPETAGHLMGEIFGRDFTVDEEPLPGDSLAERVEGLQAVMELLRELEDQSPERWGLIAGNRAMYRKPAVVMALLQTSRETWQDDPARARLLVDCGLRLLEQLGAEEISAETYASLKARGLAYRANLHRIVGDFRDAEQDLAEAREWLGRSENDPVEQAELLECEAVLRRGQRRFDEARELLSRAVPLYRQAGRKHVAARAEIVLAFVLREQGEPERSNDLLDRVLRRHGYRVLGRDLYLSALENLAVGYAEAGRAAEARKLLPHVRSLAERQGRMVNLLRVDWLEARVCHAEHNRVGSEGLYRDVREAFLDLGISWEAALVSLDLALLHLEHEDATEARKLAEEMLPVFRSLEIPRETMASVRVLIEALQRESATAEQVKEVTRELRSLGRPETRRIETAWR